MSVIEAITANASRIPNGGALPKMGFIHCPRVKRKSAVKNNRTLISYFAIRLYLIRCGCVAASPKVFFFHSS